MAIVGTNKLLNILRRKQNNGQLLNKTGPTSPNFDSGGAKKGGGNPGGFDGGWPGDGGPGIQYRGGANSAGGNAKMGRGKGVMGRYSTKKNRM